MLLVLNNRALILISAADSGEGVGKGREEEGEHTGMRVFWGNSLAGERSTIKRSFSPSGLLKLESQQKNSKQNDENFGKILWSYTENYPQIITVTLKCLSIGTPNTTIFPFIPNGNWGLLDVPIFKYIIIRL